jgi:hypothetical protein
VFSGLLEFDAGTRMHFAHFTKRRSRGVFSMTATLIKIFPCALLCVFAPLASSQNPVDCYPECSAPQIASAKVYLESEISFLSIKHERYLSKINALENDILFVKFNIRRSQIGSVVKSTATSWGGSQFTSWGSPAELEVLTKKLEKLEDTMYELEKEKRELSTYRDHFVTLVPKYRKKIDEK